jgi:hypothetical protein
MANDRYLAPWVTLLAYGAVLTLAAAGATAQTAPTPDLTVDQIRDDIGLIQMLNRLDLKQAQIEQILPIATDLQSQRDAIQQAGNAPEAKAALMSIRQALIEGKQGPELEQLQAPLQSVWQSLDQKEGQLHDAVQKAVTQVLALLEPAQVDAIARGEAGDPAGRLMEAVHQARHVPPAEYDRWVAAVSHEIALGAAMGDQQAAQQTETKIQDLLKRARELNDADFEAQAQTLGQEAVTIVQEGAGQPDPQWRDRRAHEILGGILMHPRLAAVLKEKLDFMKAAGG